MTNKNLLQACEKLAKVVMFVKVVDVAQCLNDHGLAYRKGKDIEDIRVAVKKGKAAGLGKIEFEIRMVEIYLTTVLKLVK